MDNRILSNRNEVKFLRELFTESPHISVDQAAKECDKFNFPIHKGIISQVRRSVREGMLMQAGKPILAIVPAPPAPTVVNQRQAGLEPEEAHDSRTPQRIKEDYVEDLMLEEPSRTTTQIQKMVIAKFGSGIAPPFLTSRLAIARELAGLPVISKKIKAAKEEPKVQPVLPKPEMPVAESPKSDAEKEFVICWMQPGGELKPKFDIVKYKELESMFLRIRANDGRNIRVFEPVEFEVEVKVKFKR